MCLFSHWHFPTGVSVNQIFHGTSCSNMLRDIFKLDIADIIWTSKQTHKMHHIQNDLRHCFEQVIQGISNKHDKHLQTWAWDTLQSSWYQGDLGSFIFRPKTTKHVSFTHFAFLVNPSIFTSIEEKKCCLYEPRQFFFFFEIIRCESQKKESLCVEIESMTWKTWFVCMLSWYMNKLADIKGVPRLCLLQLIPFSILTWLIHFGLGLMWLPFRILPIF